MKFDELPEVHQNLLSPYFDPSIPTSFASLLPPGLASNLLKSLVQDPELFPLLSMEEDLREYLYKTYTYRTPPTDERMRMSFWLEYERALLERTKMVVQNVHSLVCDERSFYRIFCTNPGRTAFLLCRPVAYQEQVKEMLAHGLRRMRQILDLPEVDAKGKLNLKLLELKTRITAMMDMRVNGAPTQKVQQLNVNVDAKPSLDGQVRTLIAKGDINAIQSRLHEIESQLKENEGKTDPAPAGEVLEPEVLPAKR